MTYSEFLQRAERTVTPFVQKSDPRHSQMVQEIAREFKKIAMECDWQKEELCREVEEHKETKLYVQKLEARLEEKKGELF